MKIERVTRFAVDGKEFESFAKAQDYIDGEVNKILTKDLINKGFSITDCVRVTETVLTNRVQIARLLSCAGPDATEWEE